MTATPPDPLLERLRAGGLIDPAGRQIVLLSGGRDSTCLLHAAVTLAGAARVTALHVNYRLRSEADADEAHCGVLCARLGAELVIERPGPAPAAGNLQAWARERRYAAARALAAERGAGILVGHTADDQAETIAYRLIAAPSRRAVLGMDPDHGDLRRPLLSETRAETTAYCERHALAWREDASNTSPAYVRNRVRHQLLPLMRELHPGADRNLLALAQRLREEGEVLDGLVRAELAGEVEVRLARLRELPPALARLVLQQLADDALGAPAAGAAARLEAVLALADAGTAGIELGHGLLARASYGRLEVRRAAAAPAADVPAALAIPGEARWGGVVIRCELAPPEPVPGALDREVLPDALVVRGWRSGDRIRPLGLSGTKSLQDLFTQRRVPRDERAGVPVVLAGEEIVWVAGLATADRVRITPSTRTAIRLTVRDA